GQGMESILTPLPYIAEDIVEAQAVGGKTVHRAFTAEMQVVVDLEARLQLGFVHHDPIQIEPLWLLLTPVTGLLALRLANGDVLFFLQQAIGTAHAIALAA